MIVDSCTLIRLEKKNMKTYTNRYFVMVLTKLRLVKNLSTRTGAVWFEGNLFLKLLLRFLSFLRKFKAPQLE